MSYFFLKAMTTGAPMPRPSGVTCRLARIPDMTTNIATTATQGALLHLLQVFNAGSLGEGDLGAGANVLAAKAISLTNLHPPGACLITAEGNRLQVGMSFAAVGG